VRLLTEVPVEIGIEDEDAVPHDLHAVDRKVLVVDPFDDGRELSRVEALLLWW